LRDELEDRRTPGSRELRGEVRHQLSRMEETRPWWRRRGVWITAVVAVIAGLAKGISEAVGFNIWVPFSQLVQNVGRQVGLF
jgi:hypothetical protein